MTEQLVRVLAEKQWAPEPLRSIDELLDRALDHGLAGEVSGVLLASGALAGPVADRARMLHRGVLGRHLQFVREARYLRDVLEGRRIPHAFVKGPVIAALHHPDPTSRSYLDLDVLIAPEDLPDCIEALLAAGYRLLTRNWPLMTALLPAQVELASPGAVLIDLHWHLVLSRQLRLARRMGTAVLLQRCRPVDVGGVVLSTLDATDTLVHLCVHAADSGGDRLVWLFDVDAAVRSEPPDWPLVVARARECSVTGQVALMLRRAMRAFGTPVPAQVVVQLDQCTWTRLDRAVERLVPPGAAYPAGSLSRTFVRATAERPGQGVRQLTRRATRWLASWGLWHWERTGWLTEEDRGSGLFDGGGTLEDYLRAVAAEANAPSRASR